MFHLDQDDDAPHLTLRERQVLELVARGWSAKETAVELGIAYRTVQRHMENARNKMRARNKAHMIAKAMVQGELVITRSHANDSATAKAEQFMFGGRRQ